MTLTSTNLAGSDDSYFVRDAAVVVAVSGTEAGYALAGSLAIQGARVVLLTDVPTGTDPDVMRIETSFGSRESVNSAFAAARESLGSAHMVIHSAIPVASFNSAPIDRLSYEQWRETTHVALKSTLYSLQAAHDYFDGKGGSIVVFGPALSLVGAAGLVPLSTALEAQRSLVKSAARQWGRQGIRVNWVAIGESNYSALASAAIPQVPELGPPPPPLGYVPEIGGHAAALIGWLCSYSAREVTGATLNIDGGNWMLP